MNRKRLTLLLLALVVSACSSSSESLLPDVQNSEIPSEPTTPTQSVFRFLETPTLAFTRQPISTTTSAPPTNTATASTIPATPTSPPVPPLVSHVWRPSPILIEFGRYAGDGVGFIPADLTLLGNGKLYIFQYNPELDVNDVLYEADLSRQKVCQLLNTIDQTGFFQYDPAVVEDGLLGDGGGGTFINVDAWSGQEFSMQFFRCYLERRPECMEGYIPPLLPPIVNTYNLLNSYQPNNLRLSDNQTTAVFISEFSNDLSGWSPQPWPASLPSLSEYIDENQCENVGIMRLTGSEALEVRELLPYSSSFHPDVFLDEDRYFYVDIKAILPEDNYPVCSQSDFVLEKIIVPDLPSEIACSPDDDIRVIPTQ